MSPAPQPRRRRLRACLIGSGLLGVLLLTISSAALAANDLEPVPSRIGRPLERGPALITAAGSLGGMPAHGLTYFGYAFGLLLRPLRAAELIDGLYAANTGLNLQIDVQRGSFGRRIVSGDLVLRHYLREARGVTFAPAAFWGLGAGISQISVPREESTGGNTRAFSFLGELGVELGPKAGLVLFAKAQYRHYRHDGYDYSGWSLHVGAGLPLSI